MSKRSSKKKVIAANTPKSASAKVRNRSTSSVTATRELTFGRDTYIWIAIGFGLVLLGMLLMSGGHMPDDNTWDENIIYSTRRTLIAPIVILAGLAVEVYAIFKK